MMDDVMIEEMLLVYTVIQSLAINPLMHKP